MTCWGSNSQGQAEPPPGQFTHLSSGTGNTCALATDGTVACWGQQENKKLKAPNGKFNTIAPFRETKHCGVKTTGAIACWPDGEATATLWPEQEYILIGGPCAVPKAGDTICVGTKGTYKREGPYSSLSAYQEVCGLDENQQARCWNQHTGDEVLRLPGKYQSLSIGEERVVCAVHTDGTITCTQIGGRVITPPELRSRETTAVAMSHDESIGCAILASGQPFCWDWNESADNPQTWPIWGTITD